MAALTPAAFPLELTLPAPELPDNPAIAPDALVLSLVFPDVAVAVDLRPEPLILSLFIPRPTVLDGIGPSALTLRSTRVPRVYVRNPYPPHERMAELVTAHNVDRSFFRLVGDRGGAGEAHFHINRDDPQYTPNIARAWNIVEIESERTPPWFGQIIRTRETSADGTIEIDATDRAQLLAARDAAQGEHYTASIGSGAILRSLVGVMNLRGHSGIFLPDLLEVGPAIEELQVGGQNILQAINEVHARSGYEAWLETTATPAAMETLIRWGKQQGDDLSDEVHLFEGIHFGSLNYSRDLSQIKTTVGAYGDFGAELKDRNSVGVVGIGSPQAVDVGYAALHPAEEAVIRALGDVPPGLRNERSIHVSMTGDEAELAREARREMAWPLAFAEVFEPAFNVLTDWHKVMPGNIVTLHSRPGPNAFIRAVRCVSCQPDDEKGLNPVICEAVLA